MRPSAPAMCFLLVAAFAAVVTAGEPFSGPVQQIEGRIKTLDFTCHAASGVCKGSMVVVQPHHGDVPLGIHPGTEVRRWEQPLTLRELELGVPIRAFTFQMSGEPHARVVLIEVTGTRESLATP
jgi:hypothetical protein